MSLPIRFARSGKLFVASTSEGSASPALVLTPGHFFHLEVAREWRVRGHRHAGQTQGRPRGDGRRPASDEGAAKRAQRARQLASW